MAFPLNAQKMISVQSADISTGGLRISCSRHFSLGDKVQVRIYILSLNKYHPGYFKAFESDTGQYLQAVAEVAWMKESVPLVRYEVGLKFLDVYEDDLQALRQLILRQKQKS